MANIIRVAPAKLTSTAGSFETTAGEIKSLTTTMTSTVQQLSGRVWSGDAASAYTSKFNGLQGDINKLYTMIIKHSNHLKSIAREFDAKESENVTEANSLNSNVIS